MCRRMEIRNQAMTKLFLILLLFTSFGRGELGTAAQWDPPYLPTDPPNACGFGESDFPSDGMFAAAGEGLWDNGAACGRQYQVTCTGATAPAACIPGQIINVTIVDKDPTLNSQPSKEGTLMVISRSGYEAIATSSAGSIHIDYKLFS